MFNTEDIFLLNGLDISEKKEIVKRFGKPIGMKKGEIIYSADKFPHAIGFICSGKAFAVTNNGFELHMKSFENGACFGAAAVFGGEKYVSTVIAKTNVEVLFITEAQLKSIFLDFPQTSLNYISFLTEKIRFLNTKLSVLSCGNCEDTVYQYLSTVACENGYAQLPKSMTLVSKMLGISRATLYRCLDILENNGLISRENNKIKVIKNEKNS